MNSTCLEDASQAIDMWLRELAILWRIPGLQVTIRHKGSSVLSFSYGKADIKNSRPITDTTRFRVASHSKVFTAACILRLVDEQKLHLDTKIGDVLDFVSSDIADITIQQLLSHSSGLYRESGRYWDLEEEFPSKESLRTYFSSAKPVFKPLKNFKYSNIGFGLLGLVIEEVSGKPFSQVVDELLITPLKLSHTTTGVSSSNEMAVGYGRAHPEFDRETYPVVDAHALDPATGVTSNTHDLCVFFETLLSSDTVLSEYMRNEMMRPQIKKDDSVSWSHGLHIWSVNDKRIYGHTGGYRGFLSATGYDPESDLSVSIIANGMGIPTSSAMITLFKSLFSLDTAYDSLTHNEASSLEQYCGTYRNVWGDFCIVVVNQKLVHFPVGSFTPFDTVYTLKHVSGDEFVSENEDGFGTVGEAVCFEREDGQIVRVRFGPFPSEKVIR